MYNFSAFSQIKMVLTWCKVRPSKMWFVAYTYLWCSFVACCKPKMITAIGLPDESVFLGFIFVIVWIIYGKHFTHVLYRYENGQGVFHAKLSAFYDCSKYLYHMPWFYSYFMHASSHFCHADTSSTAKDYFTYISLHQRSVRLAYHYSE